MSICAGDDDRHSFGIYAPLQLKRISNPNEPNQSQKGSLDRIPESTPKVRRCGLATKISIEAGSVNESAVQTCGRCVFLGNTRNLAAEELRSEITLQFGPLETVDVIRDRSGGGQSRGYAFATFQDVAHARACVRAGYFFVGDFLIRSKPADRSPSEPGGDSGGAAAGASEGAKVFLGGTGHLSEDELRAALEPFGEVKSRRRLLGMGRPTARGWAGSIEWSGRRDL